MMGEDSLNNAKVDITIGHNEICIEGSEDFISEELSVILEQLNLQDQPEPASPEEDQTKQASLTDSVDTEMRFQEEENGSEVLEQKSGLESVAENLGVDDSTLKRFFFIDGDELHIENPLNITPRYALLGYCTIENVRKGKMTFENRPMKDKLVSQEGVEIDGWGDFVYNARRRGDIRDDPNSEQDRNKPFRLTRDGREAFIEWLTEGHE